MSTALLSRGRRRPLPTGKRIEFEGMDLHESRDGKLCRRWIVFDTMDVGRQLGILPPVGSRGERPASRRLESGSTRREAR